MRFQSIANSFSFKGAALGRRTLHSKTSLGGVGSNVALASRGRFLRTPAPKAQCAKIEPGLVFD
jgi:hypothetical protein